MGWRVGADVVMVTHLCFVVFVVVGGALALRWRRAMWIHLATALYGVTILVVGFTCPLTPIEKALRARAGQAGYDGGFVEHYVVGVLYPGEFTPIISAMLIVGLIAANAGIYAAVVRRHATGAGEPEVVSSTAT